MKGCFLFIMLFCHILDDFYLQGRLSELKQLSWWKQNVPDDKFHMYQNDYIVALIEHAFSWTFVMQLPILVYMFWQHAFDASIVYFILFSINWIVHFVVDDFKANKLKINLVVDQLIHVVQVFITWLVFFVLFV